MSRPRRKPDKPLDENKDQTLPQEEENQEEEEELSFETPIEDIQEEPKEEIIEDIPEPSEVVYNCNIVDFNHTPIRIKGNTSDGETLAGDYKIRVKTLEEVENKLADTRIKGKDRLVFALFPEDQPLIQVEIKKRNIVELKRINYIGEK